MTVARRPARSLARAGKGGAVRHPFMDDQLNLGPASANPVLAKPLLAPADIFELTRLDLAARRRGAVGYFTLRAWRPGGGRRAHDLFRRIKRERDPAIVDRAAAELAAFVRASWPGRVASVVNVACGHSGRTCFGLALAVAVAAQLGLLHVEAFAPRPRRGTSHPRRNTALPPLQLQAVPPGPAVLVDDLATSGWHIEEAALALTAAGVRNHPVVWLGRARGQ